jgi:methionyl-tRNA formyltransferase
MSDTAHKIIYFGTSNFAVPPLLALLEDGRFSVVAVVSQPDKPAGRKGELKPCPVARTARQRGLHLLQPEKLKESLVQQEIANLKPDLFVVAAYGKILPAALLAVPGSGAVNLHGSILPKYRGASPIQSAILAGEKSTGVSLMLMDKEMDHGPVFATAVTPISDEDTYGTLENKLAEAAAKLLINRLADIAAGSCPAQEQVHDRATYTKILSRQDGSIAWNDETAEEIARKIHAFDPWPGVFALWRRGDRVLRMKLLSIKPTLAPAHGRLTKPGTIFVTEQKNPAVVTKAGAVELISVQIEGKKASSGQALLHGYPDLAGSVLEGSAAG